MLCNYHSFLFLANYAIICHHASHILRRPSTSGASHTDLYDQTDIILFNKIETFFKDAIG